MGVRYALVIGHRYPLHRNSFRYHGESQDQIQGYDPKGHAENRVESSQLVDDTT